MAEPAVNYQEADPVTVASRFRQAREEKGLSRKQLSELTGIPVRSIERIEYATQEPSISRTMLLCRHLEVPMEEIMGEVDSQAPNAPAEEDEDPVSAARRDLARIARRFGMKVVYPGPDSEPAAAAGAALVPDQGAADVDASPLDRSQVLAELEDFAEDSGTNARGTARRLESAADDLADATLSELVDLAEERGLGPDGLPDPDTAGDKAADELRTRLLIEAVYGVDLHDLSAEALERVSIVLGGGDPDAWMHEAGVISEKGLFEDSERFRARAIPAIGPHILDAVRKRSAPDLADTKAYPRTPGDAQDEDDG